MTNPSTPGQIEKPGFVEVRSWKRIRLFFLGTFISVCGWILISSLIPDWTTRYGLVPLRVVALGG